MSDKRNTSIQDRGWNEMRALLDEELPIKDRKRRIGFWFLFGAVAAIVVLGFLLVPTKSKDSSFAEGQLAIEDLQVKDNKKATDIYQSNQDARDQVAGPLNTKENSPTNSNLAMESQSNSNERDDRRSDQYAIEHTISNPIESVDAQFNKVAESQVMTLQASNEPNQATIQTPTIENDVSNTEKSTYLFNPTDKEIPNSNHAVPVSKEEVQRIPLPSVNMLPFINVPKLDIERNSRIEVEPIIAFLDDKKFAPYLYSSANHQLAFNGSGYGIGAGLNYGNETTDIYVEAGYLRSKIDTDVTSVLLKDINTANQDVEDAEDLGNITFSDPLLESENIAFSKLRTNVNSIRLGVGLKKKIADKLKFDMGISYTRLLNGSNESLALRFANTFVASGQVSANIGQNELIDSDGYASYDLVPHIGLEYAIAPHINFGLNINYGLKSLVNEAVLEDLYELYVKNNIYKRNIAARIRYQF